MRRSALFALALTVLSLPGRLVADEHGLGPSVSGALLEGFVVVNGVHLQYLDWGGSGPALIFVHGMGDDPHVFDDLAPAFTDHFHVVAYGRRGHGNSDAKGPYDATTLTEDLRGLMDALGIAKADLVGHSAGGDEITAMAARYPGRVAHIVYLDAAYDWADPDFHVAFNAIPSALLEPPAAAMVSMGAYRSYEKAMFYRRLDDMARIDAHLRQSVVIRPDGHVETRMRQAVLDSLYDALWINPPRDYTHVRCPALAIYPQDLLDIEAGDAQQRSVVLAFEQHYWAPFRTKSIERVRRELAQVEILRVAGTHDSFFLTERQQIVAAVRRFLGGSGTTPGN